jgi:hypothetical protein
MTTTFTAVRPRPSQLDPGPLDPIPSVSAAELRPGALHTLFRSGASVVRVTEVERLDELWHDLVFSAERRSLPWHDSVQKLAAGAFRNGRAVHHGLGNVLFARPGELSYVGRRWRIEPGCDIAGDPAEVRAQQAAAKIAAKIHDAMLRDPEHAATTNATLQCIRYFDTPRDSEGIAQFLETALLTDSRLARWGLRADRAKAEARGPFRLPLVTDVYGVLRTLPGIGGALGRCNQLFWPDPHREVGNDYQLVGAPHIDSKYFTAITSVRDSIRTEYFDGFHWHELTLDPDSLCVMPGRFAGEFGLRPTRHRVLQRRDQTSAGPSLSLVLGTVPRESNVR